MSGGVDSTVAYTLCLRALGPERVHGTYVDTGLMREGETEFVRANFAALGAQRVLRWKTPREQFLERARERDRARSRSATSSARSSCGAGADSRVASTSSTGTGFSARAPFIPTPSNPAARAKADLIKTHHNRVAGIQKLIDEGRIIEPLSSFYKDEVRAIGRELGLARGAARPPSVPRARPGDPLPVLGHRTRTVEKLPEGWILPVRSVGVQGDSRTYAPVLAIDDFPDRDEEAAQPDQSRWTGSIAWWWRSGPPGQSGEHAGVMPACLTAERLDRLRRADAIVRRLSHEAGFDQAGLAIPGGPDSAGHRGAPGFGGAAAHRFGGRHDRQRRPDARGSARRDRARS